LEIKTLGCTEEEETETFEQFKSRVILESIDREEQIISELRAIEESGVSPEVLCWYEGASNYNTIHVTEHPKAVFDPNGDLEDNYGANTIDTVSLFYQDID